MSLSLSNKPLEMLVKIIFVITLIKLSRRSYNSGAEGETSIALLKSTFTN